MELRDKLHRAIDELDEQRLTLVYEQIAHLLVPGTPSHSHEPPPSLAEVLALTAASPGAWSDDVEKSRIERL